VYFFAIGMSTDYGMGLIKENGIADATLMAHHLIIKA
jgi:hypothetical protein